MKIRINKAGNLEIFRKNDWKEVYCPFVPDSYDGHCGDWCPLFSEPRVCEIDFKTGKPLMMRIDICRNSFVTSIEDWEDLR